jgi:hypothetical protein
VGPGCCEAVGDARGGRVAVEGAVQRGEEVVDVAVEGGDAERAGALGEDEGVDEGAVLDVSVVRVQEGSDCLMVDVPRRRRDGDATFPAWWPC